VTRLALAAIATLSFAAPAWATDRVEAGGGTIAVEITRPAPGLDRGALLATTPQIYDLCITERSRKHGIGWIEQDLMQRTIDITFAQNKPDRPVNVDDVFTNAYSSKIKPLK